MCVCPKVYQKTTSVDSSARSCWVQRISPSPPELWLGKSPAPYFSFSLYGVTQTWELTKPARLRHQALGEPIGNELSPGRNLYATGSPTALRTAGLIIFQVRADCRLSCARACFSVLSVVVRA